MSDTSSSSCKRKITDAVEPSRSKARREVVECAICFESVAHRTELPCACRVDYCSSCWDRALAASFRTCGAARCPTCRARVRVDVVQEFAERSPEQCRLLFSREARDSGSLNSEAEMMRLAQQARPLQIKLLHKFRDALSTDASAAPLCVCGKHLARTTVRQRVRSCGRDGSIICDLCEQRVARGSIWTCQDGYNTVLHPSSHDVCKRCFIFHTVDLTSPGSSTAAQEDASSDDSDTVSVEVEDVSDDSDTEILAERVRETHDQRLVRVGARLQADAEAFMRRRSEHELGVRDSLRALTSLRVMTNRLERLGRYTVAHAVPGDVPPATSEHLIRAATSVRRALQMFLREDVAAPVSHQREEVVDAMPDAAARNAMVETADRSESTVTPP